MSLRPVKLFNTLSRKLEELVPIEPGKVGIYCCGPTVYDYQHIGNFKTFIFEDTLVRVLRYVGYDVNHVMNITDVGHLTSDADDGEDKMVVAMKREKKKSHEIAQYYTDKFFEDWDKLGLVRPSTVPKATDHVEEMIELVKILEERGLAYQSAGNVYFDVMKFPSYGDLARLDLKKLQAGARIEVDENKRSPFDFALWFTNSKFEDQELQWDSPWGHGYPGWHIECSAMSMKYLGKKFDIHCGGIDHIPVHHTNEIAQSEGVTGEKGVGIWMHSEFININSDRMAKSKGNFIVLDNLLEKGYDPMVYRLLCLSAHYRTHLNFNWEGLDGAASTLKKLRSQVIALKNECSPSKSEPSGPHLESFIESLTGDLNTPQALAKVWEVLDDQSLPNEDKLALLYNFDRALGLGMESWEAATLVTLDSPVRMHAEVPDEDCISAELRELVALRQSARSEKNWGEADSARDKIQALGFSIEDSADGPILRAL